MRSPLALWRRLLSRFDRRSLDRDMDEEMAMHIELHADALQRAGLSAAEARRRAVAEFGGVQRYREEARDLRALAWLYDLVADLRYGARTLRRSVAFTTVSILSLGLGIGANVAIFGLLYAVLIQPLAIPRARELSALVVEYKGEPYTAVLHRTYLALRDAPGAPELVAAHEADDVFTDIGGVSSYRRVDFVDGGFFRLLGVPPLIGRLIGRDDDANRTPVVVISEDLWSRLFDRAPDIVGRQVHLRGYPFAVVGVMPRSFRGVRFNGSFTMAVPASFAPILGIAEDRYYVNVVTRAESPAIREAYGLPLDAAYKRCCREAEDTLGDVRLSLVDASAGVPFGKNDFRDGYRLMLWSLMGGVVLVLLIACSNIGNLLLARGAARERELSIRLSIGASRWRIVRQLLAEGALLGLAGAALGVALAALGTRLILDALPGVFENAAALVEFRVKPVLLVFTSGVAILSVLAFGLGPALRATRSELSGPLRDRSGTRHQASRLVDRSLVIGQVALTLVLVCGAGLLIATLRNLRAIEPGFSSTHLVALNVETRGTMYEPNGIVPLHRDILERSRAVPGVLSAAMATRIPAIGGRNVTYPYGIVGQRAREARQISLTVVTPAYFATTRTPLVLGRDFVDADNAAGTPVAIANETFVKQHFQGVSPLGAGIRLDRLNGGEVVTLVGVAHDMRMGDRRSPPEPMLYIPAAQAGKWPFFLLVIRTGPEPQRIVPALERALAFYEARLRVSGAQTMDEAYDEVLLRERLAAALSSTCAALALMLAMVGLAGLVGFSVARRTREIGVRMALGAQRTGVVWLVLRGALVMAVTGVVIGAPLSLGAGRALQSLLYGIAPTSIVLLTGASAALIGVAVLAGAVPAWRASRVDPVIALRSD